MDPQLIKLCHLIGLMLVVMGLSGVAFAAHAGFGGAQKALRRAGGMAHGIGLLLIVVTGFMMLSNLGFHGDPPTWVKVKLVIFLLLGAGIWVVRRWSNGIWIWLPTIIFLCGLAAYMGLTKPF